MRIRRATSVLLLLMSSASISRAQEQVNYLVRVDDPGSRFYHVEADLPATGGTTIVSLPAWTPGHYAIQDYARYVRLFQALGDDGSELRWDRVDKDTWRIFSAEASRVRVSFDFLADTLSLSGSLLKDDFGFFNGTNLFVYPETGYDFRSRVRFDLPDGWRVATELGDGSEPGIYVAADYHELVDNPTFVGHFAIDSVMADGRWTRVAVYPADRFEGVAREMTLKAVQEIADYAHDLFGEPPYERYTTLIYLETEPIGFAGGLEHANSHLDILPVGAFESPERVFPQFLYYLLSHEYYHAWNVKRIRPAELWPYEYDREQFTPLLWVSEGITDYYAKLILARSDLWDDETFWGSIGDAISAVRSQPVAEAVEDASLSTWIDPVFVVPNYYYDKGALLGLQLDIIIRQATENQHGLDAVMARLYHDHFKRGRGFTTEEFLDYVGEYIGDEQAQDFYRRYVDGREPLPLTEVLGIAGVSYQEESTSQPVLRVGLEPGPNGEVLVSFVAPDGPAAEAGLEEGDELLRVGVVETAGPSWLTDFRQAYADAEGEPLPITFRRDGQEMFGETTVATRTRIESRVEAIADAGDDAIRIRQGILDGTTH